MATGCMLLLIAVVAAGGECTAVDGPRILGQDLKRAAPALVNVDDSEVVGFTPEPGMERRLSPSDGRRFGPLADGLCFRRRTTALGEAAILEALHRGFGDRRVSIELIDHLRTSLPEGRLEFPLSSLTRPVDESGAEPVVWRGRLVYDGNHTLPVWAKVRLTETRTWLEATVPLKRGQILEAGQTVARSGERFPVDSGPPVEERAFEGLSARRAIAAGEQLRASMFEEPRLIARGDPVAVEVESGEIRLRFEGRAENGGRRDEWVVVFDPNSGRKVKGRIAAPGKVIIDANPRAGGIVRGDRRDRGGRADQGAPED